jgi:hypothetical protein
MLVHERVVIPRAASRCVIFDSATHATLFPRPLRSVMP